MRSKFCRSCSLILKRAESTLVTLIPSRLVTFTSIRYVAVGSSFWFECSKVERTVAIGQVRSATIPE